MPNIDQLKSELDSINGQLKRILSSYIIFYVLPLRKEVIELQNECLELEIMIQEMREIKQPIHHNENLRDDDGLDNAMFIDHYTFRKANKKMLEIFYKSTLICNKYNTILIAAYSLAAISSIYYLFIIFTGGFTPPTNTILTDKNTIASMVKIAKLIVSGLVGSFIYFIGDKISNFEIVQKYGDGTVDRAKFTFARIAVAILIPIALYILFIDGNSQELKLETSPEVISFACGYSYKLGITLCNKVVDKATKLVQALLD